MFQRLSENVKKRRRKKEQWRSYRTRTERGLRELRAGRRRRADGAAAGALTSGRSSRVPVTQVSLAFVCCQSSQSQPHVFV